MTRELDLIQNALRGASSASVAPPGATNIVMILDRSGSMSGTEADVIGGFNSFVASCREAGLKDCTLTYVRFDAEIEHVFTLPLPDVPPMTALLYQPRGSTALLDAVGQSVSALANNAGDRYLVITHTDGHENASREWTREKVAALLRERQALENWTFAFFGADIDAWEEAGGMGYRAANAAAYSKQRTRDAMAATGRVAGVMSKAGLMSSYRYAAAAKAAMDDPGLSDAAIERQLKQDGDGGGDG
ncbi:MAG: VWA domain-containing protein [Chloroflexi bacterium]|nr:VWA domain-containing protein [Chloroflexota bacterium]